MVTTVSIWSLFSIFGFSSPEFLITKFGAMYEQYSSEEEDGTSRSRSEGRRRSSALSAEMAMANVRQAERKKSIDEEEKRAGGGGERERRDEEKGERRGSERRKEEEEGRMRRREVTEGQRTGRERKEEGERRRKERKGEDRGGKEEEEERRRGRERRKEEEEKGMMAEEGGGRERKEEGRRSWSVGGEAAKQRQKLAREGEERMKEAELEEEMKGKKEEEGTDERVGAKSNGKGAKSASGVPRHFSSAPVTLPQSRSDHFSFACHLFPRLSESNLQFHDIYWDRDPDTKRHVCVTKLIRSITVRLLGPSADQLHHFRADLSLLDRRPFARRQIVSNIFSVPVPVVQSKLFRKVPSSASVLVRSNYRQPEVALQIMLQRVPVDTSKPAQTVGRVELDLLDAGGQMALPSRTHSRTFDGTLRLDFEMADVPAREQLQADSLPDVLICDESWLPMLAIYRQLMCEQLARAGDVFADRSTWVLDPVMATFPRLLDTDQDAIDLLMALLHKFDADKRDLPPCECSRRFRFVFLHFILPLTALVDSSAWRQQLRAFVQKGSLAGAEPNPFKAFATEPCKPIDTLEYALSLCGEHAID